MFGYMFTTSGTSISNEKAKLTASELIDLADSAERKGNSDRAIMHLESVIDRLESTDIRIETIEEKIKQVE